MDGKGKFKVVLVAAAVLAMLGGAAAVKLGWVGEFGVFLIALSPMFMMWFVTGIVLRALRRHWGWWAAPTLGAVGVWLAMAAKHPGLGFLDATAASPLLGVLGPVLVVAGLAVAAFMSLISKKREHDFWETHINKLKAKIGVKGANADGVEVSDRFYSSKEADIEQLKRLLPDRDKNGDLKDGFPIGVATNKWDADEAHLDIGVSDDDDEMVVGDDGEVVNNTDDTGAVIFKCDDEGNRTPIPVIKSQAICQIPGPLHGKPIYDNYEGQYIRRIRKGTARAPLLIADVSGMYDGHMLISGVSGGGKTSAHVINYVMNFPDSLVVGDPKGEILRHTGRALVAAGKRVFFLDPKRKDSWSFDLLYSYGLYDKDLLKNLKVLSNGMIEVKDEKGGGQFYKTAVRNTLEVGVPRMLYNWMMKDVKPWLEFGKEHGFVDDVHGLLMEPQFIDGWLRYGVVTKLHTIKRIDHPMKVRWFGMLDHRYPEVKGLHLGSPEAHEWLRHLPNRPTIDDVVRWLKQSPDGLQADINETRQLMTRLVDTAKRAGLKPHPVFQAIEAGLSGWEKPSEETWANFAASVGTDLGFMNDPSTADLISGKTQKVFTTEDVLDGNSAMFICFDPDTIASNPGIIKLVYATVGFEINARGGLRGKKVAVIVDEAAQLGKFDLLHKQWLPFMRSLGMRLVCIIQSPKAFDEAAGEGTFKAWLGLSKIQIFFGINDPDDCETLSKMCGHYQALVETTGGPAGSIAGMEGGPANLSTQIQEKRVIPADKIKNLPKHLQLIFLEGGVFAIVGKAFWFRRPEFVGHVVPTVLPEIAFPDIEALYSEIHMPEVQRLVDDVIGDGDMHGQPVKNVQIKSVTGGTSEANKAATTNRKKEFLRMGGKWHGEPSDLAGYWYIPAYTDLAPFRELGWVTGLPPQKGQAADRPEASGDAPEGRATHGVRSAKIGGGGRMCPQCGARMERRRDHRHGSDYLKCASCPCVLNPDGTPRNEAAAADAFARLRTSISSDQLVEAALIVDRGFGSEAALGTVADARATDDADGFGGKSAEREDGGEEESQTRVDAEPFAAAPADVDKEKAAMLALLDEM